MQFPQHARPNKHVDRQLSSSNPSIVPIGPKAALAGSGMLCRPVVMRRSVDSVHHGTTLFGYSPTDRGRPDPEGPRAVKSRLTAMNSG